MTQPYLDSKQPYLYSKNDHRVWQADGRSFDPWCWRWVGSSEEIPGCAEPVSAAKALLHLKNASGLRMLPVGVIGPRDATPNQMELAEAVGGLVARHGLAMICGGKTGVMAAAAAGARAENGITIGMLPDTDWRAANDDITLPLATGLLEARNIIIARSSLALIAVGGSSGTLTEMAYAVHFDKLLVVMGDAPVIEGSVRCETPEQAFDLVAQYLLELGEV